MGLVVCVGCTEVAPTNPYDPDTPVAQQAVARLSGQLVLPEGFFGADHFDGQTVALVSASEVDNEPRRAAIDIDGQFEFNDVAAGIYQLQVSLSGFESVSFLITAERGTSLLVPDIFLRATQLDTQSQRQWIRGQVQLMGRSDNEHGQVVVSIVGTPYTTRSAPEGLFELEVPPGTYTLRLTHPDYSEQRLPDVFVEQGMDVELGNLVLTPFSGALTFALFVDPQWLPIDERFGYVTIDRVDSGYVAVRNLLVFHNEPITIEGLPAGQYRVSIQRPGFSAMSSPEFVISTQVPLAMAESSISLVRLADTEISLEGRQLNACDLRRGQVDLRRADLSGTTLSGDFGAVSAEACTPQCDTPPCAPLDCDVDTCAAIDLTRARLTNADFTGGSGSRLVGSHMVAADLFGAKLSGIDLSDAELSQANLFGVRAEDTIFSGADLSEANLSAADLRGAIFGRVVGEQRHEGVLPQDLNGDGTYHDEVHPWLGRRVAATPFYVEPCTPMGSAVRYPLVDSSQLFARATNLNRTVLSQANLTGASLMGINLSGAVLNGVRLVDADLRGACLEDSILTLLDLTDALFDGADLQGARLSGAVLYRTQFRGANLQRASLGSSVIDVSDFGPWVSIGDGDACADVFTADFESIDCATNPSDPRCACLSRLDGADLSGSLIQGSRFVGASLTHAQFNSTTISESQSVPLVQPDICAAEASEVAYAFCAMNNQCDFFEALFGNTELSNLDCDAFADAIGSLLPGDLLGGLFGTEGLSCVLSVYESEGQCLDPNDENLFYEYVYCFPEFVDEEVSPPTFPQRTPYQSVCTFDAIRATLSQDECSFEDYQSGMDCCPEALIPYFCSVSEASFVHARFDGSIMRDMSLNAVNFKKASLRSVELVNTQILSSNLDGAILADSNFARGIIRNSSLVDADLRGVYFTYGELDNSNLSGSNLTAMSLTEAQIRRTELSRTRMIFDPDSNTNLSVGLYQVQIGSHQDDTMYIRDAQWTGLNISGVVFQNLNFEGGDLSGNRFDNSRLERVYFRSEHSAELEEALFQAEPYNLQDVDFLPEVDLAEVEFFQSELFGVSFDRVVLDGARFWQVDFDEFKEPGRRHPSRFERIHIDGAQPLTFLGTNVRRTEFSNVSMPNTRFGECTIEETEFGGRGGVILQGAQFGGDWIDVYGERTNDSLIVSESIFRDVDFRGADFSHAEFRSANSCKMNLFNNGSDFTNAVFSTPDSAAVLSGVFSFSRGLEMSFRGVCACEDAIRYGGEFIGGPPVSIPVGGDSNSMDCGEYTLDCAPWPGCTLDLYR